MLPTYNVPPVKWNHDGFRRLGGHFHQAQLHASRESKHFALWNLRFPRALETKYSGYSGAAARSFDLKILCLLVS